MPPCFVAWVYGAFFSSSGVIYSNTSNKRGESSWTVLMTEVAIGSVIIVAHT